MMTEEPELMNIIYEGGMKFHAVTMERRSIAIEPSPSLGGSGDNPNPIDYLLAALGSCAGIKALMDLTAQGQKPDLLRITITGKRRDLPPLVFENLHVTFHLPGGLDEAVVACALRETMTLHCPVAVMMGKATTLTWDYRTGA